MVNEAFKQIIAQVIGYSFSMFLGVGVILFLQRGFLLKFIRVKSSMGRLVLIRIKQIAHWDYAIGAWDEGDLLYGPKGKKKRINNITSSDLDRSLGINWIDIDGKDYCILPHGNTDAISGFDPVKQEALVTRALYNPPIADMKDNIIIVLIILALIAAALSAFFGYNILNEVALLKSSVEGLKSGLIVATG